MQFVRSNVWGLLVLLTGAGFLLFGIRSGEAAEVMQKAVKICLECIGIG